MLDKLEQLVKEAQRAADVIRNHKGMIRAISHIDCDGVCSAAIIVRALAKKQKTFHFSFARYLNEATVNNLAEEAKQGRWKLLVFTDLGSGAAASLAPILEHAQVIIADHHMIATKDGSEATENSDFYTHPNLINVNPLAFGLKEDISGSGMTYILSRALDPENVISGDLAIIGAIGDAQTGSIGDKWQVLGLNQEILKDAETAGSLRVTKSIRLWGRFSRPIHKALELSIDPYIPGITGNESAAIQFLTELGIPVKINGNWRSLADLTKEEQQRLVSAIIIERLRHNAPNPTQVFGDVYELPHQTGEFRDAQEFATIANACGKSLQGYLAVGACLGDEDKIERVRETVSGYKKQIGTMVSWVFKNKDNPDVVRLTDSAAFVFGGDKISEELISTVSSIVQRSGFLNRKILIGFGNTPNGEVKISSRADDSVNIDLNQMMRDCVKEVGGNGGGHLHAAGGQIPSDKAERFVDLINQYLSGLNPVVEEKPKN
ncbi:MAG: DHH family phosphoesterase [Candidatus Aenigmarchaeota archaeon]|nr:DHH family phosphoesterase [Candidatus Aenigmarchaeota archaeon]